MSLIFKLKMDSALTSEWQTGMIDALRADDMPNSRPIVAMFDQRHRKKDGGCILTVTMDTAEEMSGWLDEKADRDALDDCEVWGRMCGAVSHWHMWAVKTRRHRPHLSRVTRAAFTA